MTTAVTTAPMNALWSYAYARNLNVPEAVEKFGCQRVRFFGDSGAHSARTLGIHLDTDNYGAWLRKWHSAFTVYANLDVIYAPEATYRNQKALERQGLQPMPVFHTGEPWSWLHRYLDEGYTYIALGKLLGNGWNVLAPWLAECFRIGGDRCVFHGFGLTAWKAIGAFPFYSVDSSSWGAPYRFGTVKLFDRGTWVTVHLRQRADVLAHRRVMEQYGLPITAVTRDGYDKEAVARASAQAYIRAGEWIARRHGTVRLPPGKGYPDPQGVHPPVVGADHLPQFHLYLAEGSIKHHLSHADVVRARETAS